MKILHAAKNCLEQDPRASDFVSDPYSLYRQLHETGEPVFWENYGFWCLSSFDSVNGLLRDRRFARLPPAGHERPAMPAHLEDFAAAEKHSLLCLEPPEHTHLRKTVNRAFVGRQVNQMADSIRAMAHRHIDSLLKADHCDLLKHYATPIPVTVITQLLGVPESAGPQLIKWSHDMVRVYTMTQSVEEEHMANLAAKQFQQYLQQVIDEKRGQPGEDLLAQLLHTEHGEQPLSDHEIISVSILLLNAGHEATVHQLGNAVKTLLNTYPVDNRDALLTILADDAQCDALVTECLRYDAPLHMFTRYAQEDVTLADSTTISAGEEVGLLLAAANRCPVRFADADTFNPARADGGHVSLGAGLHFCVGAQLAKLELRIALQVLFERLPDLQLAEEPQYQDAYHFHGLTSLRVCWH